MPVEFRTEQNTNERPTVLIVDDVPVNLQVLGELLQNDYRVLAANSGAVALRIAATPPSPDLILLDIMMPGMDGYQVLTALRENPLTRDIPVIFLTALDNEQDERRGLELGAVDFISKPMKPAIVQARVRNHLELKQARDALHRYNEALSMRLDLMFNYSQDILCVAGFNGYFKELNPAFTRILGWPIAEAQARPWLEFVHPEDALAAAEAAKNLAAGQPLSDLEIRFRHLDGHYCWLSWNAFPVAEESASFCVIRDVTAQKYAALQMQAVSESLEWLIQNELSKNREKDLLLIQQSRLATMGELITNISHHWRQPLNALAVLLANILDAYEYHELDQEYLEKEVSKGHLLVQRMSATIEEFRSLFKTDSLKSVYSLNALAKQTINLLGATFDSSRISITVEATEEVQARGYPSEYSQVLVTLLNNARDAINARQITPGVIVIRIAVTAGVATLSVSDNGGGIAAEQLTRIFEPYITTRDQNAGIGLFMARMLIEHQDGKIEARNTAEGAELTIFLPLAETPRP